MRQSAAVETTCDLGVDAMTASNRFKRSERGQTLVEFALATAVILTVVFGLIDLGRALYTYNWVADSARKGARFMMVRGNMCRTNMPDDLQVTPCPATQTDSLNYVKSLALGLDQSKISVSTTCQATGGALIPPPCAARGYVRVQVTYNFNFITPFVNVLPWNMTSSSQIYVQN
jgi:Flp pilus assembly protein TadG